MKSGNHPLELSGVSACQLNHSNCVQAEERAREESERLRQQEREQIAEKRRRDLVDLFLGP